ncbi:MAG: hypothetical protein PHU63_03135 [Candidatus ainarchaeum sp.]|nr:hypothetical protein [Candidatus ainarchaeum sp.]
MGVKENALIFELAKPSIEPFGVKIVWSVWYTMNAVHQARRKAVFDKYNPLEAHRFL